MQQTLLHSLDALMCKVNLPMRGSRICVAVSGGADSMALLYCLSQLCVSSGFTLCVGHVDHELRSQSGDDCAFVRDFCQDHGIDFAFRNVDVLGLCKAQGLSPEAAARKLRYEALQDICHGFGAKVLVTAHHASDQAETMILQLLRGGVARGIRPVRAICKDLVLMRPMLQVAKADVDVFVKSQEIPFVEDTSNRDPRFLRNRLRQLVLPTLTAAEPGAMAQMGHAAQITQDEDDFMDGLAKDFYLRHAETTNTGLRLALDALFEAPLALQRRVMLHALWQLGLPTNQALVHRALDARGLQRGLHLDLCGGYIVSREANYLHLRMPPDKLEWQIPCQIGRIPLPSGDIVQVEQVQTVPPTSTIGKDEAYVHLPQDCVFRQACPGDDFQPIGTKGSGKLLSRLSERGMERADRMAQIVLAQGKTVLWVPGYSVSAQAALSKDILDQGHVPPHLTVWHLTMTKEEEG